jgi:hypothetical protein
MLLPIAKTPGEWSCQDQEKGEPHKQQNIAKYNKQNKSILLFHSKQLWISAGQLWNNMANDRKICYIISSTGMYFLISCYCDYLIVKDGHCCELLMTMSKVTIIYTEGKYLLMDLLIA